jgi:WD40 repeat protein
LVNCVLSDANATQFQLQRTLRGHADAINHLSISLDGSLLASGGMILVLTCIFTHSISEDDASKICIWLIETGELSQIIEEYRGPVSAFAWISLLNSEDRAFVVGYADGSLVVYRKAGTAVSIY